MSGAFQCDQVYWRRDCTGYRLPTEAEWEAAARAGTDGLYWWGDDEDALPRYENCHGGFVLETANERPHNPFRLHHMLGNVSEWVFDMPSLYAPPDEAPWVGPVFPSSESEPDLRPIHARIYRGGSVGFPPRNCRASRRFADPQHTRSEWLGLRLVRTVFE